MNVPAPDPFTPLDTPTTLQPPTEPSGNDKLIEMGINTPQKTWTLKHVHTTIPMIHCTTPACHFQGRNLQISDWRQVPLLLF